jgi:hypothetical protein
VEHGDPLYMEQEVAGFAFLQTLPNGAPKLMTTNNSQVVKSQGSRPLTSESTTGHVPKTVQPISHPHSIKC